MLASFVGWFMFSLSNLDSEYSCMGDIFTPPFHPSVFDLDILKFNRHEYVYITKYNAC